MLEYWKFFFPRSASARPLSKVTRLTGRTGPNTLAFGQVKPYSGSLKDGLDLVYCRDPGLNVGDQSPLWTQH
jgi:hypothetical protein